MRAEQKNEVWLALRARQIAYLDGVCRLWECEHRNFKSPGFPPDLAGAPPQTCEAFPNVPQCAGEGDPQQQGCDTGVNSIFRKPRSDG